MLIQDVLLADLEQLYTDSIAAARGADLIVSHWLQIGGALAAETLGIPWVSVTLHPAGVSCFDVASSEPGDHTGDDVSSWLWGERLHQFRAAHHLSPVRSIGSSLYSRSLNLVAASRHLVPECANWPQYHVPVGFFFLDEQPGWQPNRQLTQFLERYNKVIVVSFSSVAGSRIDGSAGLMLDALERVGLPAILQTGWSGLRDTGPSERVLNVIGDIPHRWLFPRACCVVHHGGAGTTAAALHAGVPSVIIWHMFDQSHWGNLLAANQLGPRPIVGAKLAADVLAERINEAVMTQAYGDNCRMMAASMKNESGVDEAVRLLQLLYDENQATTQTEPISMRASL